ncbi:MAG: hypothetical protein QM736_04315 [Vicinamibacterales bacterium]
MNPAGRDAAFVEQAYWIVLNRPPSPIELADQQLNHLNSDQVTLSRGLLHSQEFRRLRAAWRAGHETHADPPALERALQAIGPDAFFVERVYQSLLARSADAGGRDRLRRRAATWRAPDERRARDGVVRRVRTALGRGPL